MTLIDLLKKGCKISFPNGYSFLGQEDYILLENPLGPEATCGLDEDGILFAMEREQRYERLFENFTYEPIGGNNGRTAY